jgi:hypothetical protein
VVVNSWLTFPLFFKVTPLYTILKALSLYWIPAKFALIEIFVLYWNFTQRALVVGFQRFGKTYRSHLQGSSIAFNKEV